MIQTKNSEVKAQTNRRLARIEGQLRGVQKMIDDERDCREVLQQLIAIRSGIQSATMNYLQEAATECLLDLEGQPNPTTKRETLAELIKMLGKAT